MKTKRLILNTLLIGAFVVLPSILLAQTKANEYTLLEPLPIGEGGGLRTTADTSTYLSDIFRLTIILASALAVFQLIRGGFMYITSAAIGGKNEAKKIIQETLLGLALVLGSWIIVGTIMPESIQGDFFVIDLNIPAIPSKPNTNLPTGEAGTVGLQQSTKTAVSALRQECNCAVRITSTTGDSHTTNSLHYQGLAVDIGADANLTKYITGQTTAPQACATYSKTLNGVNASFKWEPKGQKCGGTVASTGDHWHMSVTQ